MRHDYTTKPNPTKIPRLPRLALTPRTYANLKHLETRLGLDTIALISTAIDLLATLYPPKPQTTAPRAPINSDPTHINRPLARTLKRLKALAQVQKDPPQ